MKETRQVRGTWDLTAYQWKIESGGFDLLLKGYKDKKILGVKCHKCATVYVPGVDYCRKCFIDIDEIVEVSDHGKVATYTVNIADIRIDGGVDLVHQSVRQPQRITLGQPLSGAELVVDGLPADPGGAGDV